MTGWIRMVVSLASLQNAEMRGDWGEKGQLTPQEGVPSRGAILKRGYPQEGLSSRGGTLRRGGGLEGWLRLMVQEIGRGRKEDFR